MRAKWLKLFSIVVIVSVLLAAAVPAMAAGPSADKVEFELLANYVTQRLKDWTPTIDAAALYENLNDGDKTNDPFILSVRKPEDYAKGHVPGAYNIFYKNLPDPKNLAMLPKDRQIVVYCYTGHTGQVSATLLRLLGYDAVNLKWGMMGWTKDEKVLATTPFAGPMGYPTETTPHELTGAFEPPVWKLTASDAMTGTVTTAAGATDAVEIIRQHAAELFPKWVPTLAPDALYENLNDGDTTNDPFILSVRKPEDYAKGHIAGAGNILWKNVAMPESLAKLPPDRPIVAYCYTGHTGQVATTVLALLGYNAINLKYGMMGWTNDAKVLATTPFEGAMGYPTETTPHTLP